MDWKYIKRRTIYSGRVRRFVFALKDIREELLHRSAKNCRRLAFRVNEFIDDHQLEAVLLKTSVNSERLLFQMTGYDLERCFRWVNDEFGFLQSEGWNYPFPAMDIAFGEIDSSEKSYAIEAQFDEWIRQGKSSRIKVAKHDDVFDIAILAIAEFLSQGMTTIIYTSNPEMTDKWNEMLSMNLLRKSDGTPFFLDVHVDTTMGFIPYADVTVAVPRSRMNTIQKTIVQDALLVIDAFDHSNEDAEIPFPLNQFKNTLSISRGTNAHVIDIGSTNIESQATEKLGKDINDNSTLIAHGETEANDIFAKLYDSEEIEEPEDAWNTAITRHIKAALVGVKPTKEEASKLEHFERSIDYLRSKLEYTQRYQTRNDVEIFEMLQKQRVNRSDEIMVDASIDFLNAFMERRATLCEIESKYEFIEKLAPCIRGASGTHIYSQSMDQVKRVSMILEKYGISSFVYGGKSEVESCGYVYFHVEEDVPERLDARDYTYLEACELANLAIVLPHDKASMESAKILVRLIKNIISDGLARIVILYTEDSVEEKLVFGTMDYLCNKKGLGLEVDEYWCSGNDSNEIDAIIDYLDY